MNISKHGWKVAVAGECMVCRTFSVHCEPEFIKIKEIMTKADVCYGHLEMNFGEFSTACPARGDTRGSYMLADPAVAKDLHWLGIDIMSLAHNHSFNFGAPIILDTIRYCREAGMTCAGTGRDLEEAREPGYWEGETGRVALVATSTGNDAYEWANLSKGSMPTRPGINPLRINMRYCIPADDAKVLRRIGEKLGVLRLLKTTIPSAPEQSEFSLIMPTETHAKGSFCEGEDFSIESSCNPRDLEGNLRSIDEANKMADFVMVAHHFSVSEGPRGDTPPSFAREFAHAAIDAGADVYFGHGWHKTLGIEIYHGRPIFYGLGNFFAQSQFIRRVPYDGYESWGLLDNNHVTGLRPSDKQPERSGLKHQFPWWNSAIIELEYTPDKEIKAISIHPVELGRDASNEVPITRNNGRPFISSGQTARRTLERFQTLSKPFGTEIMIKSDIGRWES